MLTRDIHSHQESVTTALYDLDQSISLCKRQREKLLCIIVGYGSTGKTHKIQTAVVEALENHKLTHKVKDYIKGSSLDIFNVEYQQFKYKNLIPKSEIEKKNPGVIYVVV